MLAVLLGKLAQHPKTMSQQPPPTFNPRLVPAQPAPAHELAVDAACLTAAAIRSRFGAAVQWTPDVVQEPSWGLVEGLRRAAVLVALVQRDELHVVLTHRSAHLPTHAGQVAFAGGKIDASDASAEAAALREAHEEIGVPPAGVSVFGRLTDYTTGTGFHITPVVALLATDTRYLPEAGEVDQVFEVPLSFVADPANHRRHEATRDGITRQWWSMPYTDASGQEHFIWGATAGMLRNFYQFLRAPMP